MYPFSLFAPLRYGRIVVSSPCHSVKTHVHNEFTGIIEKVDDWYIGYCVEVPGANGQGRTMEECKKNLAEAVELILEDRRKDALRIYNRFIRLL